jgi:hypothetical protein
MNGKLIGLLLVCSLAAGCAAFEEPPVLVPLSAQARTSVPVVLAGDNQEHELAGLPSSLAGGLADSFAEVTIRQPLHSLFGRKALEFAGQQSRGMPLVHLGDLLDLSCYAEFTRMKQVLDQWPGPVVIAPGNHDGLLNGIFNFGKRELKAGIGPFSWNYRCQSPNEIDEPRHAGVSDVNDAEWLRVLSKDAYIERYITMLGTRPGTPVVVARTEEACPGHAVRCVRLGYSDDAMQGAPRVAEVHGISYPSRFASPHALSGHRSMQPFTRSWLLQRFFLPAADDLGLNVSLMLLDTTNIDGTHEEAFDHTFSALSRMNPGSRGYIGCDQREALRAMIERRRDHLLIFAGHHHWLSIHPADRSALLDVLKATGQPLVYLSAHTHEGFWRKHYEAETSVLEFNVSSLADWPVAYRQLQFSIDSPGNRVRVSAGVHPMVDKSSAGLGEGKPLLEGWKRAACEGALAITEVEAADVMVKRIVQSHREQRGNLLHTLAVGEVSLLHLLNVVNKRDLKRWVSGMYTDSRNDLHHALRSVAEAARLRPEWGQRLYVRSGLDTACKGVAVADCVEDFMELVARETQDSAKKIREAYSSAFAMLGKIQAGISALHDTEDVAFMACLSALGAYYDWSGTVPPPPLKPTFYWTEWETDALR